MKAIEPTPTPEEIAALSDAMWQLLDDMGETGRSVCLYAKAKARVAYEPFRVAESAEIGEEVPCDMPLATALEIITEVDRR